MAAAASRILLLACMTLGVLGIACGDDEPPLSEGLTLQEALRGDSPPTTRDEAKPVPAPSDPALIAYEEAKHRVAEGDLPGARAALNRAVEIDPQFAEAWYQLGAAETNMAIEVVHADEGRAVQLFRDGVDHKRMAEILMRQGAYRVWTPAQQEESWSDLQQAMEGVDELLADEATLVSVLKMYAGGAR